MNLRELRALLDYHYWARDRILDAVEPLAHEQLTRDMGNSFRSIRDTLTHICSAEWVWCSRWQGTSPTEALSPEMFPDVAALRAYWADHETRMRARLEAMGENGLSRVVEYKMFNGQGAASPFWEMLQHVVNHATYHRGQVTTLLRQLGAAPPKSTDLITFYRERGSVV